MIADYLLAFAVLILLAILIGLDSDWQAEREALAEAEKQKRLNTGRVESMVLEDGQWIPLDSPAAARTLNHPFRLDLKGGGCEMIDTAEIERARR